LPLMVDSDDEAAMQQAVAQVTEVINAFPALYATALLKGQRAKLGLQNSADDNDDTALVADWLTLLQDNAVDFTLAWRRLCDAADGDANPLRAVFAQPASVNPWLQRWAERCALEDGGAEAAAGAARAQRMRTVNPWIIARNHRVEEALAAASAQGDLLPFKRLLAAIQQPWTEDALLARYAEPAPAQVTAGYQTFCGT
jgi:serine/tyrosine/threonine adenylyltransferase